MLKFQSGSEQRFCLQGAYSLVEETDVPVTVSTECCENSAGDGGGQGGFPGKRLTWVEPADGGKGRGEDLEVRVFGAFEALGSECGGSEWLGCECQRGMKEMELERWGQLPLVLWQLLWKSPKFSGLHPSPFTCIYKKERNPITGQEANFLWSHSKMSSSHRTGAVSVVMESIIRDPEINE